jgi:hypothetical protein
MKKLRINLRELASQYGFDHLEDAEVDFDSETGEVTLFLWGDRRS